ncbi:MAG: hypothetical protein ACLQUY_14050 [Ktedonobacterales bacterium]
MSDVADEKVEIAIEVSATEDDISQDEETHRPSHWIGVLEWFDEKVYVLVGIAFLVAALLSLVYGLVAMAIAPSTGCSCWLASHFKQSLPTKPVHRTLSRW